MRVIVDEAEEAGMTTAEVFLVAGTIWCVFFAFACGREILEGRKRKP